MMIMRYHMIGCTAAENVPVTVCQRGIITMVDNKVLHGDCQAVMPRLPDNYFDGMITSPPYGFGTDPNHGKGELYNSYKDILAPDELVYLLNDVFYLADRVIKPNGTICMVVSYKAGLASLPYTMVTNIQLNSSWELAEEITWKKNSSIPLNTSPRNLSRICEKILVFARRDELGSYVTNKQKGTVTNGQQFYKYTTNFIEAKNRDQHPNAPKHSATYSRELVRKIMDIYYTKGSRILDPFAGLGTTVLSAKQHGRIGTGIEIDTAYVEYANKCLGQSTLEEFL